MEKPGPQGQGRRDGSPSVGQRFAAAAGPAVGHEPWWVTAGLLAPGLGESAAAQGSGPLRSDVGRRPGAQQRAAAQRRASGSLAQLHRNQPPLMARQPHPQPATSNQQQPSRPAYVFLDATPDGSGAAHPQPLHATFGDCSSSVQDCGVRRIPSASGMSPNLLAWGSPACAALYRNPSSGEDALLLADASLHHHHHHEHQPLLAGAVTLPARTSGHARHSWSGMEPLCPSYLQQLHDAGGSPAWSQRPCYGVATTSDAGCLPDGQLARRCAATPGPRGCWRAAAWGKRHLLLAAPPAAAAVLSLALWLLGFGGLRSMPGFLALFLTL